MIISSQNLFQKLRLKREDDERKKEWVENLDLILLQPFFVVVCHAGSEYHIGSHIDK